MNDRTILEKERKLSQIIELELKTELSNIRNFERLTDEKLTPYFVTMAKKALQQQTYAALKIMKVMLLRGKGIARNIFQISTPTFIKNWIPIK